ncbi:MAG: type II toxin-antitoxin system VapC family toxin [Actinobacteria bacterium]|nr:type II toxin-antitoxin system VapC family toxin [Actinomycetota bacterium]
MAIDFVDTNVFIRHFTNDDPDQAERAGRFFAEVEDGRRRVTTSKAILVEVAQVLTSKALYNASRRQAKRMLAPLLALRGFTLRNKRSYLEAIELFARHRDLSFPDAVVAVHAARTGARIVSFDLGFDRVDKVKRVEP